MRRRDYDKEKAPLLGDPGLQEVADPDALANQEAAEKLSLPKILAYGFPALPYAASCNFMSLFQFVFYSESLHVPVQNLNLAFVALQFFLLVGDPLLGWFTDTTNTRWGRRRPFLAIGGPLLFTVVLLAMNPPSGSQTFLTAWFGVGYMVYNLMQLAYLSPYQALGVELSLSSSERNRLFSASMLFYQGGVIISTALPQYLLNFFGIRHVYLWFTVACLSVGVISIWVLCAVIKERKEFTPEEPTPLVPGLRRSVKNPAFKILLAVITILNSQPYFLVLLPYWVKYSLSLNTTWQSIIMTCYFVSTFVFIPVWTFAAKRFGKKRAYMLAMVVAVLTYGTTVFVGEDNKPLAVVVAVLCGSSGVSLNANNFLFQSIQADVIEYDELLTGKRREAQYSNIVQVFNALTSIMSVTLPLFIMNHMGFVENSTQTPTVRFVISFLIGPGCSIFALLALIVFFFYPITSKVHARIVYGVELHKQGKIAEDPVTGRHLLPPTAVTNQVDDKTSWFLDYFSSIELRGVLRYGGGFLLISVCVSLLVWSGLVGLGVWVSVVYPTYITGGSFIAMIAGSFILFHLARIPPAYKMWNNPVDNDTIYHHINVGNSVPTPAHVGSLH